MKQEPRGEIETKLLERANEGDAPTWNNAKDALAWVDHWDPGSTPSEVIHIPYPDQNKIICVDHESGSETCFSLYDLTER